MSARKLVIFDCDGTLVDSQNAIVAAMNEAFRENELEPPSRAETLSTVGLSPVESMQKLQPDAPEDAHVMLATSYKLVHRGFIANPQHVENLFEGARETLMRLANNPLVLLGIATGNSQRGMRRIVEQHQLQGCFTTIQTADDAPSKPHPAMIHQAIEEAEVEFENTVMVGDTTYDIDMAHRAGIAAIGVGWGYHTQVELKSRKPKYFVNDFKELNGLVDKYIEEPAGISHG